MVRVLSCIGVFILLSALIFAQESNLTCQYRYNTTEQVEKLNVYDRATGGFITNAIRAEHAIEGGKITLKLYNDYDVPITVRAIFDFSARWWVGGWQKETHDGLVTISARDFQTVVEGRAVSEMAFHNDTLRLIFQDNNQTVARYEKENIISWHCPQCNGHDCFDDGVMCNNPIDCGSKSCVVGQCSSDGNCCYRNICSCASNEIQCGCNSCVKRNVMVAGTKTSCNLQDECAFGLLMNENGVCIKPNGAPCTYASECEAGYCTVRQCSTNSNCYQGKCLCETNETQCRADSCVPKKSLAFGDKTVCNLSDECVSGRTNSSGFCIKSIAQETIEGEDADRNKVILLLVVILFGIGIWKYVKDVETKRNAAATAQKIKEAQAKTEQIKAETERKLAELRTEELKMQKAYADLENVNADIKELKKKLQNKKRQLDEFNIKCKKEEQAGNERLRTTYETQKQAFESHFEGTRAEKQKEIARLDFEYEQKRNVLSSRLKETYMKQKQKEDDKLIESTALLQKRIDEQNQLKLLMDKEEENAKPFQYSLASNRRVVKNPYRGGYLCFYEEDKSDQPPSKYVHNRWVHISVWTDHRGYPKTGYVIHHKDFDKYNNAIENLEMLTKEEHEKIHRLRRVGMGRPR